MLIDPAISEEDLTRLLRRIKDMHRSGMLSILMAGTDITSKVRHEIAVWSGGMCGSASCPLGEGLTIVTMQGVYTNVFLEDRRKGFNRHLILSGGRYDSDVELVYRTLALISLANNPLTVLPQ